MTIIVHPETDKLICIADDGSCIDWFNVIGFDLELTKKNDYVNLFFAACFFDEDNKLITEELSLNEIPMTYYRVVNI